MEMALVPLQKVQNNHDNYNVFAIENENPEQPESVTDAYLKEQERDLLAYLIDKLKCEIDDSKNRNKFLESSHKALVDKLKGENEDFKTKNKSLESSNNHFKEANNELSKTNQLMFKDLKRFQSELDKYHDVNYASKVAIDCAKAKGDLNVHTNMESRNQVVKCECLEKELSKSKTTSKSFEALQKHAINLKIALQQFVSKSSVVTTADAPNQRQQQHTTPSTSTTVAADTPPLNIQTTPETTSQAPTQAPTQQHNLSNDSLLNIFGTKDHPLEQVIGNPSQSIRTRRQLETDGEMCMFALTVSRTEPKNMKEAMADSAWIKAMQEELHQFDRLDVWELVDRPVCKNVINMKWIWKNKHDERNTIIHNKACLVAKGYAQKEGINFE
ncbi:gag-pol polyprotein [Tanacetum coccineum]